MKEITWDDYYSRFWDLAPSTQRSYSYKLSDYGSADEVFEVIEEFALEDDGFASRFATKALNAGVRFTPDHILELTILVDKDVLSRMAETATGKFTREQLEEIHTLINDSSYEVIARKASIYIFEDDFEEEPESEDTFEPEEYEEEYVYEQSPRKGPGFWTTLFAILAAFGSVSSKSKKRDTGRCDGDCDNCPAHYGYRYGRWYYGHGHQHGCQRGGNGGASGRTYRD